MRATAARSPRAPTRLRTDTGPPTRRRPDDRTTRQPPSARAPSAAGFSALRRATAGQRSPARSPTARAPREGRAVPLAPHCGRRGDPYSQSRNEPEERRLGDVSHLPATGLDLFTETVRLSPFPLVARVRTAFRKLDDVGGRLRRNGQRLEPEDGEPTSEKVVITPLVQHGERFRGVEVVLERSGQAIPGILRCSDRRTSEDLAESLCAHRRRSKRLVGVLERLAPVTGHEEQQQCLAAPAVERILERNDVADRLRHLLAAEAEQPVVHPDAREPVPERPRLRELVLVMR